MVYRLSGVGRVWLGVGDEGSIDRVCNLKTLEGVPTFMFGVREVRT